MLRFHDLARFDVYGALFAQGTAIAPIVLTAAAAAPQPNSWSGLHLAQTGSFANLDHVVVEYAGNSDAGPQLRGSRHQRRQRDADQSTVWHNAGTGVYVSSGLTLTGATISDNGGHGVIITATAPCCWRTTTSRNNGGYGVMINGNGATLATSHHRQPAQSDLDWPSQRQQHPA